MNVSSRLARLEAAYRVSDNGKVMALVIDPDEADRIAEILEQVGALADVIEAQAERLNYELE